jgi:hypothetical protein
MVTRSTGSGGGFAGHTAGGDVYAGRDGNVYRKNGDSWQKYDNGGWNNTQTPSQSQLDQARGRRSSVSGQLDRGTYDGLNRDSAAGAKAVPRSISHGRARASVDLRRPPASRPTEVGMYVHRAADRAVPDRDETARRSPRPSGGRPVTRLRSRTSRSRRSKSAEWSRWRAPYSPSAI